MWGSNIIMYWIFSTKIFLKEYNFLILKPILRNPWKKMFSDKLYHFKSFKICFLGTQFVTTGLSLTTMVVIVPQETAKSKKKIQNISEAYFLN